MPDFNSVPWVVAVLQPRAEISQRLRRKSPAEPGIVSALKPAESRNAFGVMPRIVTGFGSVNLVKTTLCAFIST